MEILLVEDSLSSARFAIESLRAGNIPHRVTLVVSGLEAMEFLRHQGRFARAPRPDLILLDLYLPDMTGFEVLAEVRHDDELKEIPVVVMTASDAIRDMRICKELGVESYMTKPVDLQQFISVIKELRQFLPSDLLIPVL